MCGIWGIVARNKSGLYQGDMDAVKMLMLNTVYRGEHSTGLFVTDYQDPSKSCTGVKVEGGPHNIIYNKQLWDDLKQYVGAHGGAIIGHGRHATRGKINAKNAHPFVHDHITLVHNGTIYNGLSYSKKGDTEVEVDSHALTVAIAERGIKEALTDIHGAYAIIVHDREEECLWIARNKERPLWMYVADDRFYFMSEPFFLRPTVIMEGKLKDNTSCAQLKEDLLFKIDLTAPNSMVIDTDLKEFAEEKRAKKWKEQEEERKKRAASNTNVTNMQQWPKYTNQQKYSEKAPPKPTIVRFEVLTKTAPAGNGSNYTYECETMHGEKVYFLSNQDMPEYIGKVGMCRVQRIHNKNQEEWFFVKHRAIEWLSDENLPVPLTHEDAHGQGQTGEEEDDPLTGAYFLTANGKRIKTHIWDERRIHEGCNSCDATFTHLDYRNVTWTDDDKFLCSSCAGYFHIGQTPDTKPTVH